MVITDLPEDYYDSFPPEDYEPCDYCGFDHAYEQEEAYSWHISNPCSYCNYDGKHEDDCPVKCWEGEHHDGKETKD